MSDFVALERIITDYEQIHPLAEELERKMSGIFNSNDQNDTLVKLVVDRNPARDR